MSVVRYIGALVLLMCAAATRAQGLSDDDFHPTDTQVEGIQQSCTVNETGILALQQKVGSAIADWNKATAGARPAAALKQLDGYFDQVRKDGGLSGRKAIYILCVEKALRQFVDERRETPQAVVGSGSSNPLQRSSFSSEEDMWRNGCKQAQDDAVSKLQPRCGDRTFILVGSECAQLSGSVRTYTAEVQGECRGK